MRLSKRRRHTSMRLPEDVLRELKRYAERHRRTPGAVISQALKEWIEMQQFPGIDYRWTPSGREPFVSGTGLSVREMWLIWKGFKKSWPRIRYYYANLKKSQVDAAVAYGKAHPEETKMDDPPPSFTVVKV